MLEFQLKLSLKRRLPLSRLLDKSSNSMAKEELLKIQEESASAQLKTKQVKVKLEDEEVIGHTVKEEEGCPGKEVLPCGSAHFTLRIFPPTLYPE